MAKLCSAREVGSQSSNNSGVNERQGHGCDSDSDRGVVVRCGSCDEVIVMT